MCSMMNKTLCGVFFIVQFGFSLPGRETFQGLALQILMTKGPKRPLSFGICWYKRLRMRQYEINAGHISKMASQNPISMKYATFFDRNCLPDLSQWTINQFYIVC